MPQIWTIMDNQTYSKEYKAEQPGNNKEEGEKIISKLKSSKTFCKHFFYGEERTGKTPKKVCTIAPMRSKMIFDLKKDYDVNLNPEDFSTILYLTLWAEGSWSPLNRYAGCSSFYAWLKRVARNAVMEWLVEEHIISEVRSRTVGNTRLALLSKSPYVCKRIIDDLLVGSKYHGIMTAIYVDRLTKEAIMKCMKMSDSEFEIAKKAGENKLKDALLRSVDYYEEDVLRDKKGHVVTVSSEFVADISEWCKTKMGANPLADVLGTNLSDEEVSQKTMDFLLDFSEKLNWSDQDRYIWRRRFLINADPESLAEEVGHSRAWLDTRYSRLNKRFEKAIKQWWDTHAA